MIFKVTNVICRFNSSSGGAPRTVSAIAKAGLHHWQSELFTTDYTEAHADALLVSDFPGRVVLLDRFDQTLYGGAMRALGFSNSIRRQILQSSRPDVLHLHGLWSPLLRAFARISESARIPYIVAPHGMLEPWSLTVNTTRKRIALRTYQGRILAGAAAIHATSEAEADHVRRLGFDRKPIYVVPNAMEEPEPSIEIDAHPPIERRVLLFLSRVHEKKGLDMLLRVWGDIKPAQWELKIVGHGESSYVESLKRTCRMEGLSTVQFHDHVDGAMREAMFARATAFILPTYSENFGNAVGEAMLRGLPVITTTGTPWSVIAEKELGWYVEPTGEALKAALQELFSADPGALRAMGRRARDYVKSSLLISAVRPRLMEMYSASLRH